MEICQQLLHVGGGFWVDPTALPVPLGPGILPSLPKINPCARTFFVVCAARYILGS